MTVWEAVYLLQPPTTWTSTFCSLPQCSVFNYCTFVHHTHMSVVFERGVIGLRSVPDVVFRVFTELWPLTNELTHNVTVAGMRLRISVVQQIWNVLHSTEYTNDHVRMRGSIVGMSTMPFSGYLSLYTSEGRRMDGIVLCVGSINLLPSPLECEHETPTMFSLWTVASCHHPPSTNRSLLSSPSQYEP